MTVTQKKPFLEVITGNRDLFPASLEAEARTEILSLFRKLNIKAVLVNDNDSKQEHAEPFTKAANHEIPVKQAKEQNSRYFLVLPDFRNGKKAAEVIQLPESGTAAPVQAVQDNLKPVPANNGNEIITIFNRIYKALQSGYSIDELLLSNMGLSNFLTLVGYDPEQGDDQAIRQPDCVDNAILYMREHINENISLGDLSRNYNYSVSRFSNLFKQKTGYTPIDYFLQMKMQKACRQLDLSNLSIKEIAFGMGFDDPYYFSKRFRSIIGISPKKYRLLRKSA